MVVEGTDQAAVTGGAAPAREAFMLKLGIIVALVAHTGVGASPRVQAQALRSEPLKVQIFAPEPAPPPPGVDAGEWDDEAPPRPARVCQKMCANDFSPCDPIYFKTEDGRCDGLDINR
jgi:hypothetical protein